MTRSASARRSRSSSRSRRDAVEQPAAALQRVRPADALEAADQHLVGGLEEEHARARSPRSRSAASAAGRSAKNARGRARRPPTAIRWSLPPRVRAGASSASVASSSGRQVVDDVPAEVLQDVGRRAPAGAGHAGDDDELGRPGSPAAGRRPAGRVVVSRSPGVHRRRPARLVVEHLAGRRRLTAGMLSAAGDRQLCRNDRRPAQARCPAPRRSRRPWPPGAASASRSARSSALRRISPSPGTPSSGCVVIALDRRWPVEGDREPVRLVADPLQQVQPLAGARQDHRVRPRRAARPPPAAWPARTTATSSMPSSASAALRRR